MNRFRESRTENPLTGRLLAGAYHMAGQEEVAKDLASSLPLSVADYTELSGTYGSALRDRAMLLDVASVMEDTLAAESLLPAIARSLDETERLSTQTAGYALLALAKYAGIKGGKLAFEYQLDGKARKKITRSLPMEMLALPGDSGTLRIQNTGETPLYVRLALKGVPSPGSESQKSDNLRLDVTYKDTDGKVIDPGELTQGSQFVANVWVANPGARGHYQEVALSQIFPSGWEILGSTGGEYRDVRDDRVHTYFDLASGKTKNFTVRLIAAYPGRYYLPALVAEAMYDHTIAAVKKGRWVEVRR